MRSASLVARVRLAVHHGAAGIALGALALGWSSFAQAQSLPVRPGLPQPPALQNQAAPLPTPPLPTASQGAFQPPVQQVGGVNTAALNQRVYDVSAQGPGGVAGAVVSAPQPQEEFFYIDEDSQAPERLAGQVSVRNEAIMGQAGRQLAGDYDSVHRVLDPRGTVQSAWSRPFDNMPDGQTAPGVVRFQWSADLVMPVRIREGFVSNIILPDWDAVEDVMIGDQSVLEAIILRSNVVGVKPLQIGSDATLNVLSASGNVYSFYIRSEGRNTRAITDINIFVQAAPSKGRADWFNDERRGVMSGGFRASVAGPQDGVSAMDGAPAPAENLSLKGSISNGDEPVPLDRRFFTMRMFEVAPGDKIIAPEYVYTDGRWTYLHFPAGVTDRPAIFRVSDDVEGRVNTRVIGDHGEVVVIEAIGNFVLRSGRKIVCLIQKDD